MPAAGAKKLQPQLQKMWCECNRIWPAAGEKYNFRTYFIMEIQLCFHYRNKIALHRSEFFWKSERVKHFIGELTIIINISYADFCIWAQKLLHMNMQKSAFYMQKYPYVYHCTRNCTFQSKILFQWKLPVEKTNRLAYLENI